MVSAIFLLVVLVSLGAAIVSVSTTQSVTSAQDLQGSRAYHAARAGIEWGIFQIMDPAGALALPACPGNISMAIEGFTVTVQCATNGGPFSEAGGLRSIQVYRLTSTATSGSGVGALNYVERQVQVTFSKCITTETGALTRCS